MRLVKIILMLLLVNTVAVAGVNLKNGNFYVSYTDIIVPGGGHDLELMRTYNSKSVENGWFGWGWGSSFETYLTVGADGSVTIHENGSGALTRFVPKAKIDPKLAAKKIIDAMRKESNISDKKAKDYLDKFAKDADLRQMYARRYNVAAKLAVGTKLYSSVRGVQVVKATKDGFDRTYNSGKVESFSQTGSLNQIKYKNGYKLAFTYNKTGTVKAIKDSQGKQLFFEWYPNRKIKSVKSTAGKIAEYKFDKQNLVESKDVVGNVYKYVYDDSHNLTSVTYSDKTKMEISYEKKTQFVSRIKARNGEETIYKYGSNPKNKNLHYWTDVEKKLANGKISKNHYEYEIKKRPDGAQYTYRVQTIISGVKTETVYNEDSLPTKIERGKFVTNFKYKNGMLTEKTNSRGDVYKLEYDPKFNKISKVVNNKKWTTFKYDRKGNLAKAVNSDGKSVLLLYDRKGRITTMKDSDKKNKTRELKFKYNSMGKPVEISMSKVGTINVAYDNYGDIKNVKSPTGQKMALQVTQAFQSLLAIVKPAGVSLNL